MKRIEYHCAKCGVHHDNVFDDGPGEMEKDIVITVFV